MDDAAFFEAQEDAAQITRVQSQLFAQIACRGIIAVSQLIKHSYLSQGEPALQNSIVKHTNFPGVQAIEAPHGVDPLLCLGPGFHRAAMLTDLLDIRQLSS